MTFTIQKFLIWALINALCIAFLYDRAQASDLPPTQYDHPYTGKLIVQIFLASEVPIACDHAEFESCSIRPPWPTAASIIILPKVGIGGVSQRQQDILRRHEEGHLNGWPADHPTH